MIRGAVVGTGLIAVQKHLPAWREMRGRAELVAICDLDRGRAEQVAEIFGIRHVYTDIGALLDEQNPDLVDICTPPRTHAPLAVEALERSVNVLVEKPMAVDVRECDAIMEAAARSGAKVGVAHSDLFYSSYLRIRQMMEAGELGEFRGMQIFLSTPVDYITSKPDHWAHELPGGVIGETGPHAVYMSLPFVGRVKDVEVVGRKLLTDYPWSLYEDYRVNLVGERGSSTVVLTYATDQWAARVEIWGSEGVARADLESQSVVRYSRPELTPVGVGSSSFREAWQIFATTLQATAKRIVAKGSSTHEALIRGMVASLEDGGAPPVTPEEGREAVRVMREIGEILEGEKVENRFS